MDKTFRIGSMTLEELLSIFSHFRVKKFHYRDGFLKTEIGIELSGVEPEKRPPSFSTSSDSSIDLKHALGIPPDEELQFFSSPQSEVTHESTP